MTGSYIISSLQLSCILFVIGLPLSSTDKSTTTTTTSSSASSSSKDDVCFLVKCESTCQSRRGELEMEDEVPVSSATSTSLAVVLYDEEKILPHEKPVRQFDIAGEVFEISQDWLGLGVAAVVWDSAIVLAEYLYKHQHLVLGKKMIELGAGTGLTGLVAASLGADVTVTERSEAMEHLTRTLNANTKGKTWTIRPLVLDWTQPLDPSLSGQFDLVIGADIIYIEDTFQDLLRTMKDLTMVGRTPVLLSCRIRYDRDLKFLGMLEDSFEVDNIHFDEEKQIKIFSVNAKS